MKCMMNEWKRDISEEENDLWDRKKLGLEVWSVRERFGKMRRRKLSREIEEKWRKFMWTLYKEKHKAWWIERCQEVSSFKTCELSIEELSRICREVSTAKGAWWIEKLSGIYRASRKFLDGSSSNQEAIENVIKRSWKGLIDSLAVKRCRTAIKIA